jgi:hypothetical protein
MTPFSKVTKGKIYQIQARHSHCAVPALMFNINRISCKPPHQGVLQDACQLAVPVGHMLRRARGVAAAAAVFTAAAAVACVCECIDHVSQC